MARRSDLTESQSRWLQHLERCAARGERMSAYASRRGLSLGAMYEAARTLRRKGAWPAGGTATRPSRERAERESKFVRLPVPSPRTDTPSWRARLPNGVVLEGTEPVGAALVALLASL